MLIEISAAQRPKFWRKLHIFDDFPMENAQKTPKISRACGALILYDLFYQYSILARYVEAKKYLESDIYRGDEAPAEPDNISPTPPS